jgi:inorganic triphosphatase YgiF
MSDNTERELKLVPREARTLHELAKVDRLGPFLVRGRRHESQRNSFFDSPTHALSEARIGFRRRTVEGDRLARWTLKGEGRLARGLASRAEIELRLAAETAPALAIGALRDAARSRGAATLAETVADALRTGGMPLSEPYVETETDRTILDLETPDGQWYVELALDHMRLLGHGYADLEIEAELKRGDESALEAARAAILALVPADESTASKLSRAVAHAANCDCR